MSIRKLWRFVIGITVAMTIGSLVQLFVMQWCFIPSESMQNTLYPGDCILVNKLIYGAQIPDRFSGIPVLNILEMIPAIRKWKPVGSQKRVPGYGKIKYQDIVVFWDKELPKRMLVKRVVALENDILQIQNGKVLVNGHYVQEAPGIIPNDSLTNHWYVIHGADKGWTQGNYGPVKIPEHYFFVLGDNRSNSLDSRFYGFVPEENVIGRVNLVLFAKKDGKWDWQRFLHRIK